LPNKNTAGQRRTSSRETMLSLFGVQPKSTVCSNHALKQSRAELDAAVESRAEAAAIGSALSSALRLILSFIFGAEERSILLLGLDAAGKTTVLDRLALGERRATIPTIGFNVEKVQYKSLSFTCWDMGGQQKIRRLWNRYYEGIDGIIFVVDASDRDRLQEAAAELKGLCGQPQLQRAPVLILSNKHDLPHALSTAKVLEELQRSVPGLSLSSREWYVQPTVATEGKGLDGGLNWLCRALLKGKPLRQALLPALG